jgi:hypothetical protein
MAGIVQGLRERLEKRRRERAERLASDAENREEHADLEHRRHDSTAMRDGAANWTKRQ